MRIKRGKTTKKKHKKIKKALKGFLKSRRASVKHGREALIKKWSRQYEGRRKRKRDLRALWIIRLNAAAREEGLTYSKLIASLKKKKIELDRKILAEIAVNHPDVFKKIASSLDKK
ncbi:50S ribosomal protein L20 [Patescibacteria group bacterium]|nr:50S ribosomal protein L20 [Patescibacteria group bacterium]